MSELIPENKLIPRGRSKDEDRRYQQSLKGTLIKEREPVSWGSQVGAILDDLLFSDSIEPDPQEKGEAYAKDYETDQALPSPAMAFPFMKQGKKLADDVVRFPSAFKGMKQSKSEVNDIAKAKGLLERIENERFSDVDWIDSETLKRLKERFKDSPDTLEVIKRGIKGSDNPYIGNDSHQITWAKKYPEKLSFPIPSKVDELNGVLGRDVPLGNGDPFMWMDSKYKVTKNLLEKNADNTLQINTRSDLIGRDDYIESINPSKHKVNIFMSDVNDEMAKIIEPGTPSNLRRLLTAEKVNKSGIKTTINIDVYENDKGYLNANLAKTFDQKKMEFMRLAKERGIDIKGINFKENKVKLDKDMAKEMNYSTRYYKDKK